MTAEIVVANKWGIAIAADSAVTAERIYKGKRKEKIYHSANKLFMLSKFAPVGIMFYNTVTLGGTPWETIVKVLRRKLGRTVFDTLEEYAKFVFSELRENEVVFTKENIQYIVLSNIYRSIVSIANGSKNAKEFRGALEKEISRLEGVDHLTGFDEKFEGEIIRLYSTQLDLAVQSAVKNSWRVGLKRKFERYVQLLFTRKERLDGYSGIVICGFGESEVFPTIMDYYTDVVVCGRVRHWLNKEEAVNLSNNSVVLPFADTEVIRTVLDGISPKYKQKQLSEAIVAISGITQKVIEKITELTIVQKASYNQAAIETIVGAFSEFYKNMEEYREEEYATPITQTIAMLPISELTIVAETLLSMSQIHKKVNPDSETVAGPVDVAAISKGDGFVWIKRKNYFDKSLNPAFMAKYLDE